MQNELLPENENMRSKAHQRHIENSFIRPVPEADKTRFSPAWIF